MTDLNSAKQQPGEEGLSWLARNVHEWGANIALMGRILRNGEYSPVFTDGAAPKGVMWFTRDQWLTRRAELQNKPDWKRDVPEWAEWIAQDNVGTWIAGVGDAAQADGSLWINAQPGNLVRLKAYGEVLGNWRDTLEWRPQVAKSEPSSDDWHKRGELPPTGTECEMFLDGGWWQVLVIGQSRHGHPVTQDLLGVISECINCQFRPLQSERERVAAELVDVMLAVPVSDRKTATESYMSMALAIYDHLHPENKS